MNVKPAAFCTITLLGAATIASSIAVATAASTVATVAYAILAVGFGGVSIASITAYFDPKSVDGESYFNTMKDHAVYALPGIIQLVAQTLVQAVIQGLSTGVTNAISRKIGGDDVTVGVRHWR